MQMTRKAILRKSMNQRNECRRLKIGEHEPTAVRRENTETSHTVLSGRC